MMLNIISFLNAPFIFVVLFIFVVFKLYHPVLLIYLLAYFFPLIFLEKGVIFFLLLFGIMCSFLMKIVSARVF